MCNNRTSHSPATQDVLGVMAMACFSCRVKQCSELSRWDIGVLVVGNCEIVHYEPSKGVRALNRTARQCIAGTKQDAVLQICVALMGSAGPASALCVLHRRNDAIVQVIRALAIDGI